MNSKRIISVLLCLILVFSICPPIAFAVETGSGNCGADGDSVTWEMKADGTLTIRGSGRMADYPYPAAVPWDYDSVKTLVVESGVTHLASYTCYGDDYLQSVSLPETITSIGDECFRGCSKLTEFVFPKNISEIGNRALRSCDGISSITFPKTVRSIGEGVLGYCDSLQNISVESGNSNYISIDGVLLTKDKKILIAYPAKKDAVSYTIPNGVTRIGESAFAACDKLETINVPSTVSSIGNDAFSYCYSLKEMIIPVGVTSIEDYTFYDCTSLQSVVIPEGVTAIDGMAFDSCIKLENISLPSTLESIGGRAFDGCISIQAFEVAPGNSHLSSEDGVLYDAEKTHLKWYPAGNRRTVFAIPDTVTNIEWCAFNNSKYLNVVVIPDSVKYIADNAFMDCAGLTSVTIPASVTSLGSVSFYGCKNLTIADIQANTTSIPYIAFDGCVNLQKVYIPKTVTSIGYGSFDDCDSLTDIYFGGSEEDWTGITINNSNEALLSDSVTIHYNCEKLEYDNGVCKFCGQLHDEYFVGGVIKLLHTILYFVRQYMSQIDYTTYFDADGNDIPDCIENEDYTTDTDGDGLSDYQEFVFCNTSPLSVDTDGDGINDADSDNDGDTLSNIYELNIGTNPLKKDSDNDYLEDDQELVKGTDPLNPDSDGDGAKDGWEVLHGFDPLVFNASFAVTADSADYCGDSDIAATVSLKVDGEQTDTVSIKQVSQKENALISEDITGYLGSAFDFSVDGEIEEAVLTFTYSTDLGTIGDDFQPRIYYLNEEDGVFEELPDQTVVNGKVSAKTTHFSTYILLNKVDFDKIWETEIKVPDYEDHTTSSLDVVFVIDYSLSMDWNDPQKIHNSLSKAFIEKLRDDTDKAAVVKFIRKASLVVGLTDDKNQLYSALDSITYDDGYGSDSGTDGSAGIGLALNELEKSDATYKYIVFLTDGEDNGYTYSYDDLIAKANKLDVNIYSIGLGSASTSVLKKLSSQTSGSFYSATTDASVSSDDMLGLETVFEEIESETIDYTTGWEDDHISDYYAKLIKEGKLLPGNGSREFVGVDFTENPDLDGDGIINGEELKVVEKNGKVYLQYISSPIKADTDNDGFSDFEDSTPLKATAYKSIEHYVQNKFFGNYSVTILVKQPVFGTNSALADGNDVGHSFLLLMDNHGNSLYRGFYPKNWEYSKYSDYFDYTLSNIYSRGIASTPGIVGNDKNHSWDVAYSEPITKTQYESIIKYINDHENADYNLQSFNCTTFAVEGMNKGNTSITEYTKPQLWAIGPGYAALTLTLFYPYGYYPGGAGYDIMKNAPYYIVADTVELKNGSSSHAVVEYNNYFEGFGGGGGGAGFR